MHVLEPNWNMDSTTTLNLLEELTNEFLTIFEQCPSRLKKKIMASTQAVSTYISQVECIGGVKDKSIFNIKLNVIYSFIRQNKKKSDVKIQTYNQVIISQILRCIMNPHPEAQQ